MALIVQKFGGTSVGTTDRIKNVARRVIHYHHQGHQVVVVVSAMSGETNRLLALAKELSASPDPRELDVVAATGEQVTIGLLAIALQGMGFVARSYTGGQVRILTDSAFTKARILDIDEAAMRRDLEAGARELFAVVKSGKLRIRIGQRYPLARAADAHRDLEARRTTGSTVLVP